MRNEAAMGRRPSKRRFPAVRKKSFSLNGFRINGACDRPCHHGEAPRRHRLPAWPCCEGNGLGRSTPDGTRPIRNGCVYWENDKTRKGRRHGKHRSNMATGRIVFLRRLFGGGGTSKRTSGRRPRRAVTLPAAGPKTSLPKIRRHAHGHPLKSLQEKAFSPS